MLLLVSDAAFNMIIATNHLFMLSERHKWNCRENSSRLFKCKHLQCQKFFVVESTIANVGIKGDPYRYPFATGTYINQMGNMANYSDSLRNLIWHFDPSY